jgi:arginase
VVLAGDHSTAAGTIAGLRRAHPDSRIGVVWIDAHADIHSPYTTPSGNMHGMPLAVATGHDNAHHAINAPAADTAELWAWCQSLTGTGTPAIQLRDLIYVSVRDTEPAEEATIRDYGLPIVSTEEVRRIGGEAAARRCLDYLADCDLIYVSFDVDSMDATVFKGTGTPVLGGLWAHEALEINRTLLRDPRVCCWEICEINPHLDTLNSLAEVSLGIYQGVLEVLEERL